jgi:hypothetical protein
MGTPFCSSCGHRNTSGANFCSSCGAALLGVGEDLTVTLHGTDAPDDDVVVRVDSALAAALVFNRGPELGRAHLLEKELTTAGRTPEADLFLDDVTVSRRHAEVSHKDWAYLIRDSGSLNGTYVNGVRVTEQELVSGDEVQIGKFHLLFLRADQQPS